MTFSKLKSIFLPSLFSILLSGCAQEHFFSEPPKEEGEIMIVLRLPVDEGPAISRSFPTGGENGDGRENGLDYENKIYDANLFFFAADGLNPDGDCALMKVSCVYVSDFSKFPVFDDNTPFEKTVTVKVKTKGTELEKSGLLDNSEISFVTLLNAGKDLKDEINNLKKLREYTSFASSFTTTETGYARFVMTTAYDADKAGMVEIEGTKHAVGSNRLELYVNPTAASEDNTDGKKWIGETTVQRLCARVDLMYKAVNQASDQLVFSTPAGHKVRVMNVLPVNFMSKPSYLLTKTTGDIPASWLNETALGNIVWGGVEKTTQDSDRPANYVIEPSTLAKAAGVKKSDEWFGNTAAATVVNSIKDATKGTIVSYPNGSLPSSDNNGFDRMSIIGYANENIQNPECYTSDYISGLVFRAEFQPKEMWRRNGEDFEAVAISDATWTGMSSEQKRLWRYTPAGITSAIKDGDSLYFFSEEDAKAYMTAHPQDLATITRFDDGVCYYNLWLRHYNDESYKNDDADPKESYPMEYAMVRNNIYRVAVSFTGPGEPTPTMREPDTMQSRIFVRKWNKRSESIPLQF